MSLFRHDRWTFIIYAVSILFLGYAVDRGNFAQVALAFAAAFYAYYSWTEKEHFRSVKDIMKHGLIIRLLLLLAYPQLSDDYFRFIWDGLIQCQGINPYAFIPSEIGEGSPYMQYLLGQMNSPDYYSVYPPVMQWIFYGISALVGENTLGQLISLRLLLIAADMGVIWVASRILRLMNRPASLVALYALNPLVIIELIGNLHFEGLMIFMVLAGVCFLMRWSQKVEHWCMPLGSLLIAMGVMTKVVLILSIPAMWKRWAPARTLLIGLLSLIFIVLMATSYLDLEMLQNMAQSFDLYFRNFQFNSSLFQLSLRTASHWIPHYTAEAVGPWISALMIFLILLVALFRKAKDWEGYFETLLFILSIHLLFASTVHPWYIINLLAVAMFTRYRYPLVWSFMAVLSYFMYANDIIEVAWVIAIEYVVVLAYFLWERKRRST